MTPKFAKLIQMLKSETERLSKRDRDALTSA